jgi:hypothetical protein
MKFPAALLELNARLAQLELLASILMDCTSAIPAPWDGFDAEVAELLCALEVAWDCADTPSTQNSATAIAAPQFLSLSKKVASARVFSRLSCFLFQN